MSERRDLPRENRVTPVVCRVGNDTFAATTRNISAGGVYLETEWLFDPSQEMHLVIDVPGKGSISATGRPTRIDARRRKDSYQVGVAVRFTESEPESI